MPVTRNKEETKRLAVTDHTFSPVLGNVCSVVISLQIPGSNWRLVEWQKVSCFLHHDVTVVF